MTRMPQGDLVVARVDGNRHEPHLARPTVRELGAGLGPGKNISKNTRKDPKP